MKIKIGIQYIDNKNFSDIRITDSMDTAMRIAFHYMQLHPTIQLAMIFNRETNEVLKVLCR